MLMMAVAGGGSVFGVKTIGGLRRQAFEARQLGQYRLTRRIGAGGMGEVYLAEHQLLKRPCVVKLIRPDKADDPKVLARFQREVRATAKLSHWNTVEIFDYGRTDDGTFYYVMEFLPGMNLGESGRALRPAAAGARDLFAAAGLRRLGRSPCRRTGASRHQARQHLRRRARRSLRRGEAARFRPGQADARRGAGAN